MDGKNAGDNAAYRSNRNSAIAQKERREEVEESRKRKEERRGVEERATVADPLVP